MTNSMSEGDMEEKEHSKELPLDSIAKKGGLNEATGAYLQHKFTAMLGGISVLAALDNMINEGKKIKSGNMRSVENMLITQAINLNVIFNTLAINASNTEFVPHYEMLLRLAFKAQTQCRATLETLATIKNPPQVAFVKQANIGHNQQVNNTISERGSRAEEIKKQQTQLLEGNHDERLDFRTKGKAVKTNKKLATVEKIHRAENSGG